MAGLLGAFVEGGLASMLTGNNCFKNSCHEQLSVM